MRSVLLSRSLTVRSELASFVESAVLPTFLMRMKMNTSITHHKRVVSAKMRFERAFLHSQEHGRGSVMTRHWIRARSHTSGADEHQEMLAAREEDRKARQAVVDVDLVDATLVQPHELVAVASELLCPLVQLVVLEAAVVVPASHTPCETTRA